ncbi:hypothetical protein AAFF_G00341550 [Aldrovandia affinis]|uniref:Uncharacterized protein n=1 Tax=Aldrovandia affinis TaxID=143900 RepID=A0AAD7WPD2_9TELE|nr:hypothetical protein AAFF_G00341550 [Aldrovandia affinis]
MAHFAASWPQSSRRALWDDGPKRVKRRALNEARRQPFLTIDRSAAPLRMRPSLDCSLAPTAVPVASHAPPY